MPRWVELSKIEKGQIGGLIWCWADTKGPLRWGLGAPAMQNHWCYAVFLHIA